MCTCSQGLSGWCIKWQESRNDVCLMESLSLLSGISVVASFLGNIIEETGMCANVSHVHNLQGLSGTVVVVSGFQRVHTRCFHQRVQAA